MSAHSPTERVNKPVLIPKAPTAPVTSATKGRLTSKEILGKERDKRLFDLTDVLIRPNWPENVAEEEDIRLSFNHAGDWSDANGDRRVHKLPRKESIEALEPKYDGDKEICTNKRVMRPYQPTGPSYDAAISSSTTLRKYTDSSAQYDPRDVGDIKEIKSRKKTARGLKVSKEPKNEFTFEVKSIYQPALEAKTISRSTQTDESIAKIIEFNTEESIKERILQKTDSIIKRVIRRRRKHDILNNLQNNDFWLCPFCEYETIFGQKPVNLIRSYEHKERQQVLKEIERQKLLKKAQGIMKSKKILNKIEKDGFYTNADTLYNSDYESEDLSWEDYSSDDFENLDNFDHFDNFDDFPERERIVDAGNDSLQRYKRILQNPKGGGGGPSGPLLHQHPHSHQHLLKGGLAGAKQYFMLENSSGYRYGEG